MKASLRSKVALGILFSALTLPQAVLARVPYSNSELHAVESSNEAQVRQLRDQEVRELRIAIGRRLPSHQRADLYFRLAEIYLEAYRQEYLLEGRVHDKRIAAGQNESGIDHSHSRPYLLRGIEASREILKLRIPYRRMDQIYYFLAFNYSELGNHKQGLKYYAELAHRFPSSPFAAEAYREMGDAAYDADQFQKAIQDFEHATRTARPDELPEVLHKLAWGYYRVRQVDRAIATLKRAVRLSEKNGEKFLSVREEALRDMAMFMTEAGHVDEAIAYFRQNVKDPAFYPNILEKLGKEYEHNVEPEKAIRVYESLLKTNPDSEAAFRVRVKLVDLDLRRQHFKDALGRLKGIKIPSSGEQDTMIAAQNLKAMIRRTATEHHEIYRKKKDRQALLIAESYYQAYLKYFLSQSDPHKETQEIQMYLAEVERDLGKSREASELYRKVVQSRDPRYAKEAGALWTASLSEAIKKSAAGGTAKEPSALEKEYVKAADQLQESLGDTTEGREAALKAAQVLAGYPDTRKDAIDRIDHLIDKSPRSPQALTAARLRIQMQADDSSSSEGDMKDLLSKLRANTALMAADQQIGKGKLGAAMKDQELHLKVDEISRDEKDHKFEDAARGYESFAQSSSQREVAEKAYDSAVSSYVKAGDPAGVERVSLAWLKRYPRNIKAIDSLQAAATQFLIQGRFKEAGGLFELTGKAGGDLDSMETAARIFEGIGDIRRAQTDRTQYVHSIKKSPVKGTALLALARSHEMLREDREAVQAYHECMGISSEFEAECGVKLAELQERLKNEDDARTAYRKVAAQSARHKKTGLSPYVGYARFRLAERKEKPSSSFEPLSLPESKLKSAMAERLAYMESISRSYQTVVDAGGPWAVAALDRMARAAFEFANEVDRIAPPKGITASAMEQFKKNLSSVSQPLRKKALETWMNAYQKAVEAEALSPAIPELADRLADAGVSAPARAQGFHGRWRLAGIPADGGSDGQKVAMQKVRDRLARNPLDAAAWVDYGNLLWGIGKPMLSKLAYDRALQLQPKYTAALNNRGVVLLSPKGAEEDWQIAAEGQALFQKAIQQDEFFAAAKVNLALLFNYYRLFERAKPLWAQVLVRNSIADAEAGLAISLQGMGKRAEAERAFKKAHGLGESGSSFASVFHHAARLVSESSSKGCPDALSALGDLKMDGLSDYERAAVKRLRSACTLAQGDKK